MVFTELLNQFESEVKEAVEELFEKAYSNQKEKNDLLLVIVNGFYDDKNAQALKSNGYSPYVIGPAQIGYSLETLYEFFDYYRKTNILKSDFDSLLAKNETREAAEHNERLSINIELMIYLKFWESDLLLCQLYNLTNLATGEYYDWHNTKVLDSRMDLIRNKIQKPIEMICPKMYKLIEDIYSNQIRNAIAHSKYHFIGRALILANKDESVFYKLYNIPFDNWEERFHKTLLLYNYIIGSINKYSALYQEEVKDKHNGLAVSIPKLSAVGLRVNQWMKYDIAFKVWRWAHQIRK